MTAGAVFVVSIIAAVVFKLTIGKGEWLEGGVFIGLLLAALAALALVFYRESLTESLVARGVSDEQAKRLVDAPPSRRE